MKNLLLSFVLGIGVLFGGCQKSEEPTLIVTIIKEDFGKEGKYVGYIGSPDNKVFLRADPEVSSQIEELLEKNIEVRVEGYFDDLHTREVWALNLL